MVRVSYCFVLDYLIAPVVRKLERSDRILRVLGAETRRRDRRSITHNPFRGDTPGERSFITQGDFDHIHSVVTWPGAVLASHTMRNYAIPLKLATAWRTAPERKRLIKTHLNWELVPYSKEARYIAVIRDPKDVFASLYFFLRENLPGRATPSASAFYRVFLEGRSLTGSWAQCRRLSGAATSAKRTGCVVFINETGPRSNRAAGGGVSRYTGRGAAWRNKTFMLRSGKQGGSSTLLTPEQQCEMDAVFLAELQSIGSDLPYNDICARSMAGT